MNDKLLKTTNPNASTVKPSSKQVPMGSLDGSTPVKDFNSAIQAYLEKCPPETEWFKRGNKLYAITTNDSLDLASQFRNLNADINTWPKTTDIALEKLITQLSTSVFDYYDSQTKSQPEPSTPERKNSASSDNSSVGSSLSSSPEDAASISAEPAAKQEIINYKDAINKFKRKCLDHCPTWLQKALELYDVLSNENLIDDASKFDALIKKIEAWGKVDNANIAVAINQLELDLKAYYETKREAKPFFQRTNSLESGLLDLSAKSTGSSTSSPDKSPTLTRKPRRKVRQVVFESTNSGKTTGVPIEIDPALTANTTVQSSTVASSSAELKSDSSRLEQARPSTPAPVARELPIAPDHEQNNEEMINSVERAASPISDSPVSTASRSETSSPSLFTPKSSPHTSPMRERNNQQGLPQASSLADNKDQFTPRAATPEHQVPAATPAHEEPARSTTPLRQPSPALETVSAAVAAATPVTNIVSNTNHAPENKSPAEEIRSRKEHLVSEIQSLKQAINNVELEINLLEKRINASKQQREQHKRDTLIPRLNIAIKNVEEQIQRTEASFGNRSAKRWWDYIPFAHSIIPAIKKAYISRQAKLDKQYQVFQDRHKDLYQAKDLLSKTNKSLIAPDALKENLIELKESSNNETEHGMELSVIYSRVSDHLRIHDHITTLENELARCKTTKSNNNHLLHNTEVELCGIESNENVTHSNNASREPLTPV